MNPLTLTIKEMQNGLQAGTITSSQLVDAHISRILQVNGAINALIADRFDQAKAEAEHADKLLQSASTDIPPLTGIPCTIKEFIGVKGAPRTGGLLWRRDDIANEDATVVSRLRSAGAIILGFSNVPEGGLWLETYNGIYGRTSNPWNPDRTSGGSSGGEGALIAAGASPFGLGSDVGGSIRIPAAFCGTVGHKPTGGLVPNTGHFPEGALTVEGGRFLTIGPMTRTVDDAWTLLKLISGPDGIDPACATMTLRDPDSVNLEGVTVFPIPTNGRSTPRGDVAAAVMESAAALERAGARIVHRDFPRLKKGFEIWSGMLALGTKTPYVSILGQSKPLNPLTELARMGVGKGRHTFAAVFMAAAENLAAQFPSLAKRHRDLGLELQAELEAAMGEDGIILHPPYNRPAPKHWDAFRTPFVPAYTGLFNVLEFPVTQVPAGFSQEGLPLGVQVISKRGNDHLTIACAREIERELGGWKMADPT